MYQTPTRGDFQRNLSSIIHKSRAKFRAEIGRIHNSLTDRGLRQSSGLISDIVACANNIHVETINRSMELIRQFANLSQMTPSELGEAARLILQNIQVEWLAPLLTQRYEQPHGEHAARQYSQVFGQRLDGALRDIEIGFIGGRNMVPPEPMVLNNIRVDNSVVGSINTGNVQAIDCEQIGIASLVLGGGREKKEDSIDPAVGIVLHKKTGDAVAQNEPICTFHFNSDARLSEAESLIYSSYKIDAGKAPARGKLIRRVIEGEAKVGARVR